MSRLYRDFPAFIHSTLRLLKKFVIREKKHILLGIFDDSHFLINGTPIEVENDIKHKIQTLGKKDKYNLDPTNCLLDQKPKKIVSLFIGIQEFGSDN
ncbi:MAG: hypothetical protein GF311_11065 [Candidatus Lokiarchaeota archaeon]|nr:hypothetical protein [Candidatus Lokiarchaeota archaeon]